MKFRCRCYVLLFFSLVATFAAVFYFGMVLFVSFDGRNKTSSISAHVGLPRRERLNKSVTETAIKKLITREQSAEQSRRKDPVRYFVQKYSPDYPSMAHEFFKYIQDKIVNRTWTRNAERMQIFRKDLLAATENLSAVRFLYLTKTNTPMGSRFSFYQAGDPVEMSREFWNILPIKTVFEQGFRFKRCSIVGSSGLLLGSKCGREIDKADFVFRFNIANVEGFEADVGSKTNFTTINPSIVLNTKNQLKTEKDIAAFSALQRQFRDSLLWIPAFSQGAYYKFVQKMANVSTTLQIVKPAVQHPGHYVAVMRLWRAFHRRSNWPSTGLYVVSSAFELCEQINIFGFWFYEQSLEGARTRYHYHNDDRHGTRHSRFREFKDLVWFHELGIVKMQFGSCY